MSLLLVTRDTRSSTCSGSGLDPKLSSPRRRPDRTVAARPRGRGWSAAVSKTGRLRNPCGAHASLDKEEVLGGFPENGYLRHDLFQVWREHPTGRPNPVVEFGSPSQAPGLPTNLQGRSRKAEGQEVDSGKVRSRLRIQNAGATCGRDRIQQRERPTHGTFRPEVSCRRRGQISS